MVDFSFFRKNGRPAARPKPPSPRPASKHAAASVRSTGSHSTQRSRSRFAPTLAPGGIQVEETSGDGYSAVEEAAVLYANDRPEQAAATLIQCIRDAPCRNVPRPWLMLFELYQLQGQRQAFEELALEYVVNFECSPPLWPETAGLTGAAETGPAGGAAENFAPQGILSAGDEPLFQRLQQAALESGGLRLDLSRIRGMEASGSERLLDLLQGLIKSGVKIQLGGTGNLVGLLKRVLQDAKDAAGGNHWLLLLELYQILGMRNEFEKLAVEYAVALEISPPSWDEAPAHARHSPLPANAKESAATPSGDTYSMTGTVSGDSEGVLRELARFAAARQEIHIDISRVSRVDFGYMGNFLNALVQLNGGRKRVFIDGANEMVAALFSVMGVEQFATLERKKWC